MAEPEVKMTLPTGKLIGVEMHVAKAAFTLIELILVMAMLMIVLAVAAPSLSNFFRGRNLDSEARRFVSLTRYGQSRAVAEAAPMDLWIDTKQSAYGLEEEAGYTDLDTKAVDLDLGKDLVIEVQDLPQQGNRVVQPNQLHGNVPTIRFRPDGFIAETSPRTVVIRETRGDAIWITQSRNRLNYEIQTNALQTALR